MADPTARERAERILSSEEVLDTFSGCTISREKVEREILAAERAAARDAVERMAALVDTALIGTTHHEVVAAVFRNAHRAWLSEREEGRR